MTEATESWVYDVEVQNSLIDTTGGHTWEAARRLARYLAAAATQLRLATPGLRILELGSGTGWLGVTVARNLPEALLVCLTEQPAGLPFLHANVERNRARGLPLPHTVVAACDWNDYAHNTSSSIGSAPAPHRPPADGRHSAAGQQELPSRAAAERLPSDPEQAADLQGVAWDFIIGSDLIYNKVGSTCLPCVIAALAGPATQVLYCHTKHRFDLLDMEFLEQLSACGLHWEEVWEPGTPPPPNSPPLSFPPIDLFPEQRIVIYRVTKHKL